MITEAQKQERKNYIGSSDAPVIMGVSSFKTPLQLWFEKIRGTDEEPSLAMELGTYLEKFIGKKFEKETGKKISFSRKTRTHKQYNFICANLDAFIKNEKAIVEIKTASEKKIHLWQNDVPLEYKIQVLHQLEVCPEFAYAYIVGLIGNRWLKIYKIDRDEKVQKQILEKEILFWNENIIKGIPPEPTLGDSEILSEIWKETKKEMIEITDTDIIGTIESLEELKKEKKELEKEIETLENKIKFVMRENEFARAGNYFLAWTKITQNRIDTDFLKEKYPEAYNSCLKNIETRRFTIKTNKEEK